MTQTLFGSSETHTADGIILLLKDMADLVQEPTHQMEEAAATNSAKSITRSTKPDHFREGGGEPFTCNFYKHSSHQSQHFGCQEP